MNSAAPVSVSRSYGEARAQFLAAAERRGANVETSVHPDTGPDGEELAIDVAHLGDPAATSVLVIVSGTHGVEGYAGSALQTWWLDQHAELESSVRVVLLHALNPYGFAWHRRTNEDNIDLNRNFIDWAASAPSNAGYAELAEAIVPRAGTDEAWDQGASQLMEVAGTRGFDYLQQAVSGGQYQFPAGVFYGGTGPAWSNQWLSTHAVQLQGQAERVGIIDLHTGLGPWGFGDLISHAENTTEIYARSTGWYGEVRSMHSGESVSAALTGDWLGATAQLFPDTETTAVALEFGTVDTITVLESLRREAWMHSYGDLRGEAADAVRQQVRAAFCDDDPAWLAELIERFDDVSRSALAGLAPS